jgi:hypothetical protein
MILIYSEEAFSNDLNSKSYLLLSSLSFDSKVAESIRRSSYSKIKRKQAYWSLFLLRIQWETISDGAQKYFFNASHC